MATTTDGPRRTYKTAADYSEKQFYIVWLTVQTATLADDADVLAEALMGVIQSKPSANVGATVEVQMPWGGGSGKVIAGGTIGTAGLELTTDGNGKAIVSTTADDNIFGVSMGPAVVNDIFEYAPTFNIVD